MRVARGGEAIDPIGDCVVAILEGYPDAGFEHHAGCKFMEMGWSISMAQLIAASGMTAVTHSNRDPELDTVALLKHLGAKYRKVGIWSTWRSIDTWLGRSPKTSRSRS